MTDMKWVAKRSSQILNIVEAEPMVVMITPLQSRMDNRNILDDEGLYRLVESVYWCKDSKIPQCIKRECMALINSMPEWD